MNFIKIYPFVQNSSQKLRNSADLKEQREVLRTVFGQRTKNSSEKVSFSSVRVILSLSEGLYRGQSQFKVLSKKVRTGMFVFMPFAIFLSCEDILEEPDITNQKVTLLAPTDGSVLTDNKPTFNWEKVEDATAYHIQIAMPGFENAAQFILDSLMVKDTLGNLPTRIQQALLNGNYQWRVKAQNTGFETSFSQSGFTVDGDANADLGPPNSPVLESPADGAILDETEVTFSWTREDVSGSAERDSIYVYTDEDLQTLEFRGLGANKTFITSLTSNTYYWQVQAFDAAGNQSSPSAVFELTIN